MAGVRMDKWLWAARFFKTRSLAARACEPGRIEVNGLRAKAAREVRPGDMLKIKTEGGDFEVEVLEAAAMRGPAAVARTLYRETETSQQARWQAAEQRKAMALFDPAPQSRPSKRDRRRIERLRGAM